MNESLLIFIAKNIEITSKKDPFIISCIVPNEFLNIIDSSSLKIPPNRTSEEPNLLKWLNGDALYILESLWSLIQQEKGISSTFAQQYGFAWHSLQSTYSKLQVQKIDSNAIIPSKAHPLDTGFDLTVIKTINLKFGPGVILFGTGLDRKSVV